jgi:hypothetical protein
LWWRTFPALAHLDRFPEPVAGDGGSARTPD